MKKSKGERMGWKTVSETRKESSIKLEFIKANKVELEESRRKKYKFIIP